MHLRGESNIFLCYRSPILKMGRLSWLPPNGMMISQARLSPCLRLKTHVCCGKGQTHPTQFLFYHFAVSQRLCSRTLMLSRKIFCIRHFSPPQLLRQRVYLCNIRQIHLSREARCIGDNCTTLLLSAAVLRKKSAKSTGCFNI